MDAAKLKTCAQVAYARGLLWGHGWECDGEDIPDPYREAAKDSYDEGTGDYALYLEAAETDCSEGGTYG